MRPPRTSSSQNHRAPGRARVLLCLLVVLAFTLSGSSGCIRYFLGSDPELNAIALIASGTLGVASLTQPDCVCVTEGGVTDTYTVVLSSQPVSDVILQITPSAQVLANNSAAPTTLTFTPSNYNQVQTVTVTAVDDFDAEGTHFATITHVITSGDPDFIGKDLGSINVTITDNDSAGVSIDPLGTVNVTEGGAGDTYTIVLTSVPVADVTVNVLPDGQSTANRGFVTFTTTDWNIAQTITVNAVNDLVAEGAHASTISHTTSSADPAYSGIAVASTAVGITDNDSAGVSITETGSTTVTEGGPTDTYTIVLTSQPTAGVTVNISTDGQVTENQGGSVTFTTGNWNTAQTVTVTAVNDLVAEGGHASTITHTTSSSDGFYNAIGVASVNVSITDNDTAGVTIAPSGGTTNVTEGGASDTYTITLTSQPTAGVTVNISTDGQVTENRGGSVSFTTGDWNVAQTVTITAVNDLVAEGVHASTVTHSVTSPDGNYNGLVPAAVGVSITDNDTAGYTISAPSGPTTEAGAQATFTVRLNTQPNGTVIIALSSGDATEGTVSPASLTFDAGTWNADQTVTVTGVADAIPDGDIVYSVITGTPTGADSSGYTSLNPADVSVTNWDSQSRRIFVTPGTYTGAMGGVTGADGLCNTEAAGLNYPGTYKALLGTTHASGTTRLACKNADCSPLVGGQDHQDWVLAANMPYYRAGDSAHIGTTTANRIFTFPLNNAFTTSGARHWSGIHSDWRSLEDASYSTVYECSGFTSTSGNAPMPFANQTDSTSIFVLGTGACSGSRPLVCVEQ